MGGWWVGVGWEKNEINALVVIEVEVGVELGKTEYCHMNILVWFWNTHINLLETNYLDVKTYISLLQMILTDFWAVGGSG